MSKFSSYNTYIDEKHHHKKKDIPSGTALTTANLIISKIHKKTSVASQPKSKNIENKKLSISSVRCGSIAGEHNVIFDALLDYLRITHFSKGRYLYAQGVITCARWLKKILQ